jgi:hypothetical protein
LHQASFRDAVLAAYGGRCAISRLPEPRLLDAAHIVMDADEQLGQPVVSNGLPLTKIHFAAFDAHLIGVDPDFQVHVSDRLPEIHDGPFLELGLKGIAGQVNSRGHPLGNVVLTACVRVKDWGKTAKRTVLNFFAELAGPRGAYRGVIGADYQQASARWSPHMRVTTKSARSPEAAKAAMQGGRRPSPSPGEVSEGAARPHPLDSAILIAGITALFYATSVAYEDGFQLEFHFRYLSNDVNDLFISANLFGPPLLISLVITIYLSWAITRRPRSVSKVVDLSFLIFSLPSLFIFFTYIASTSLY